MTAAHSHETDDNDALEISFYATWPDNSVELILQPYFFFFNEQRASEIRRKNTPYLSDFFRNFFIVESPPNYILLHLKVKELIIHKVLQKK